MTYLPLPRALLGGAIALALLPSAHAESSGFFENSKTSLLLRNYYFNRDYNDPGASKSKVEEWALGAILKFNSGYTPGALGFGGTWAISSTTMTAAHVLATCKAIPATGCSRPV